MQDLRVESEPVARRDQAEEQGEQGHPDGERGQGHDRLLQWVVAALPAPVNVGRSGSSPARAELDTVTIVLLVNFRGRARWLIAGHLKRCRLGRGPGVVLDLVQDAQEIPGLGRVGLLLDRLFEQAPWPA